MDYGHMAIATPVRSGQGHQNDVTAPIWPYMWPYKALYVHIRPYTTNGRKAMYGHIWPFIGMAIYCYMWPYTAIYCNILL